MREYRTFAKHRPYHLSSDYDNLSSFEGHKLVLIDGLDLYNMPDSITFLKDYGNAILIKVEWNNKRSFRRYIQKSSLAIGEVKLVSEVDGTHLWGSTISRYVEDREVFIR